MDYSVKCAHCAKVFTHTRPAQWLQESHNKTPPKQISIVVVCPGCGKKTTISTPDR